MNICSNALLFGRDQWGPAAPWGARSQEPNTTRRWRGPAPQHPGRASPGMAAGVRRESGSSDTLVTRRQVWGDAGKSICRSGSGPVAVNGARCSLVTGRHVHGGKAGLRWRQEDQAYVRAARGWAQTWLYRSWMWSWRPAPPQRSSGGGWDGPVGRAMGGSAGKSWSKQLKR